MTAPRDVIGGAFLGGAAAAGVSAPTIVTTVSSTTHPLGYGSAPVVYLWASAIGFTLAGLVLLLYPQLQRHVPLLGARIAVEIDPTDTYDLLLLREAQDATGLFSHLNVRAGKRLSIRRCECWLTGVSRRGETAFAPEPGFRVRTRLHWAHGGGTTFVKSIRRGSRERLDFVHGVSFAPGGASFFCEDSPGSQTAFPSGRYRASLEFTAENTTAIERQVDFTIREWNDIEIHEVTK